MNLGIDFHDTFTSCPNFFRQILTSWPGKKYLVTGTPEKDRGILQKKLQEMQVENLFDHLLMGFNFEKSDMSTDHFHRMAKHKLKLLQDNNISIYFDDNPFYVSFLKDYGITVFQTILSSSYIEEYKKKESYFSSHLQEKQFSYLLELK